MNAYTRNQRKLILKQSCNDNSDDVEIDKKGEGVQSRRDAIKSASSLLVSASILATSATDANAINLNPFTPTDQISNGGGYQQAKRATAYLVDSTKPPSLVPFRASREAAILKNLGNGLGTPKLPYTEESLNLNNMMNKGVFGTIDLVKGLVGSGGEEGEDKKKEEV